MCIFGYERGVFGGVGFWICLFLDGGGFEMRVLWVFGCCFCLFLVFVIGIDMGSFVLVFFVGDGVCVGFECFFYGV